MKNLKEDKQAKSKSFFLNSKKEFFSKKHINFILNHYKKTNKDIRICLHKGRADKHHDMIILQQKKNFYKPHKHNRKGETYHMIKGKMMTILFSNNGKVENSQLIKKGDIYRTPINKFHTMIPISKYVIYHESKTGPFLKKGDSVFPKWIKKFESNKTVDFYRSYIRKNSKR